MVDRTARFRELCGGGVNYKDRALPPLRSQFSQTTIALNSEIALLADQVRLFRLDHARSSMSSVSKSGAAISSGADRLKRKFDELDKAVEVTRESMKSYVSWSSQENQHADRVIVTMKERLATVAKDFRESLEKRAKSLADRQERQKNLFGEAGSYRYAIPQPISSSTRPANISQHSISPATPLVVATTTTSMMMMPDGPSRPASSASYSKVRHRQPLFIQQENGGSEEFGYYPQQQQQETLIRKRDKLEMTKSRLHDVEKVEKTIGEISQMFIRVAGLVHEHGTVINDIESNVDDTVMNTNQAQVELLKLFRFVSGDRGLIIKILITVLFVGMIIIYFWT